VAEVILLDTGPLVALLDKDEEHHAWAANRMRDLTPPLMVCEAVLTEASFLLKSHPRARLQMRLWIQSGFLRHVARDEAAILRALALVERYANVPMSFADACLVAWAESTPGARLFTLDRDFLIYRQQDDKPLALLAPFAE
jgi:predicted nucleic acid-binding protein